MTLAYFVDLVRRDHADWPVEAIYWQARRMLARDTDIRKALVAGLANGRDLRERLTHGLGVWWAEMEPLTPEERGFVLALLRKELDLPAQPVAQLVDVARAQDEEKYEANADALAADWREKSNRPDSRVKLVSSMRELYRSGPGAK